ncbi:MAG: bifunctional folylpolyglutamate synthase/dihydrofolate synthase [Rickettsiales bacterium]
MPKWPPFYKKSGKIMEMLALIDNPHLKLPPVIHIAGTNGKGSTISFIKQILLEHKLKICCFTTPHILEFNESFVVNNENLTDQQINVLIKEIRLKLGGKFEPSLFELQTLLAFLSFSRSNADICLIECGMGAKNDPTNIIPSPLLSILTPISFDHEEFLGNSLEEITLEKCHIIKSSPVVSAAQNKISSAIINKFCQLQNTKLSQYAVGYNFYITDSKFIYIDLPENKLTYYNLPSLAGEHQIINLATAITAIKQQNLFNISDKTINQAIKKTKWPARLEKISSNNQQEIWFDGAHNPAGALYLARWLKNFNNKKICLIYGRTANKNHKDFLKYFIEKNIEICFVRVKYEANPESIYNFKKFSTTEPAFNNIKSFTDLTEIFENLIAKSNFDIILICGSLFLYRDLKEYLIPNPLYKAVFSQ